MYGGRARSPHAVTDMTTRTQIRAARAAEIDALLDRAWELRRDNTAAALELCDEALGAARTSAYAPGVARSFYVRGCAHVRRSDLQTALGDALDALSRFESLGDTKGKEDASNLLGVVYSELGELDEALKHFLARYQLCAGRGDEGEVEALLNLGYVHDYLGNRVEALAYYLKGWGVCAACGDKEGELLLLNNIGYSHYQLGQYQEALEHYRKALATEATPTPYVHALLLDNVALALEKLGDLEGALEHQQRSLDLREAQGDKRGVSYSLDSLGTIYGALGEKDRAQACLERALDLKRTIGDQKGEAETLLLLGTSALEGAQGEKALPLLQRALETAGRVGSQDTRYRAHQALARALKTQGRFEEALEHHERYSEVKERVVNEASSRTLGSLRVQFETEQAEREREIYRLKNVELAHANSELQALNQQATELLAQLERHAKEDALTGLYNRRYADGKLHEEFERARRFGHPLSVALCDVDNFKGINDTFSHQTGDEVLRTVAQLLKKQLREVDTVARYGGEEFLLLLPETPAQSALNVCEKLRRAVAAHPWDALAPGLKVTLSIGLSNDISVLNCEKLVALADAKLYDVKRSGKNRVQG